MVHASALAGACAGLVSSIVTCPLDVVKTRLQAQGALSRQADSGGGHSGRPSARNGTVHQTAKLGSLGATNGVGRATVSDAQAYNGLIGALKRIWKDDGFRGFYRGLGPTIFGYLPTWAIYFTVYDSCKGLLARDLNSDGEEDFLNHILSAMTAGAASTICTSPLWVVKTRFMLQSHKDPNVRPYRHTGDAFYQIFKTEGIRGFYKGLLPSLFGVSHVAVQFPLYEAFKSYVKEQRRNNSSLLQTDEDPDELPASVILACSSSAKMIASVMTYPHEVLRTRMQMQPRTIEGGAGAGSGSGSGSRAFSTLARESSKSSPRRPLQSPNHYFPLHCLVRTSSPLLSLSHWLPFRRRFSRSNFHPHQNTKPSQSAPSASTRGPNLAGSAPKSTYAGIFRICKTIATEEGIKGFYRGMGVNLIRTVPSSALTILTYEVMMSHLTPSDHDHSSQDDTD